MEEIARVPEVDEVLIGPLDLSVSLGAPTQFEHPLMKQALARTVGAVTGRDGEPKWLVYGNHNNSSACSS